VRMASLYIDRRGVTLNLNGGAISFYEGSERIGTVPAEPLERIYLRGDVKLSSGLLGRLGARGIGVVVLSGRKATPTLLLPRPHNDARVRVLQLDAARQPETALYLARCLVQGKILAQRSLIAEIGSVRPEIGLQCKTAVEALTRMKSHTTLKSTLTELRGLEGAAAASYFGAYIHAFPRSLNFSGRNRRPPRDPVNAILSLAYTLLHAEAVMACYGHGFDPFVGFLHELDFGRESLACDLVEPLRPLIDRFTWRLFAEQTLRARDFSTERDGSCLLQKAGRQRFYGAIDVPLVDARKRLDNLLKAVRSILFNKDTGALEGELENVETISGEL
jgi:CRISPR-associated protein Cas1